MRDRMEELYKPNELTEDLITNEDEINKAKKSEETSWDYIFAESADDKEVNYHRMRDVDKPATYETEVDYYDPTTIQIETELSGQKQWLGDTLERRPELITVHLLANGVKITEQPVTAKRNWRYRFSNIPVHDAQGEQIEYSIEEEPVIGYETTYDNFDIINELVDSTEDTDTGKDSLATSRTTRIGLFVLGAAAIAAGLLIDQVKKEE